MDFLSSCNEMAALVRENIRPLVGSPEGGQVIRMGADRTPTEKIDQVAEDCVIGYVREHDLCSLLISEEAGKVPMNGGKGTIFLDPIDGTYNAVAGYPVLCPLPCMGKDGVVQQAFVQDLATKETFTAVRGKFAHCNRKPIHVSSISRLDASAMSVYGRKFDPHPDDATRPQDPKVAAPWCIRAGTLLYRGREDRRVCRPAGHPAGDRCSSRDAHLS